LSGFSSTKKKVSKIFGATAGCFAARVRNRAICAVGAALPAYPRRARNRRSARNASGVSSRCVIDPSRRLSAQFRRSARAVGTAGYLSANEIALTYDQATGTLRKRERGRAAHHGKSKLNLG